MFAHSHMKPLNKTQPCSLMKADDIFRMQVASVCVCVWVWAGG